MRNKNSKGTKNNDLNTKLLGNEMSNFQPKSFFNRGEDVINDAASSEADVEAGETMESVGYRWDFAIILPVRVDQTKKPSLEPTEVHTTLPYQLFYIF
jgi:hypothetical protein